MKEKKEERRNSRKEEGRRRKKGGDEEGRREKEEKNASRKFHFSEKEKVNSPVSDTFIIVFCHFLKNFRSFSPSTPPSFQPLDFLPLQFKGTAIVPLATLEPRVFLENSLLSFLFFFSSFFSILVNFTHDFIIFSSPFLLASWDPFCSLRIVCKSCVDHICC